MIMLPHDCLLIGPIQGFRNVELTFLRAHVKFKTTILPYSGLDIEFLCVTRVLAIVRLRVMLIDMQQGVEIIMDSDNLDSLWMTKHLICSLISNVLYRQFTSSYGALSYPLPAFMPMPHI